MTTGLGCREDNGFGEGEEVKSNCRSLHFGRDDMGLGSREDKGLRSREDNGFGLSGGQGLGKGEEGKSNCRSLDFGRDDMGLGVNERCVYGAGEGVAFLESRQR